MTDLQSTAPAPRSTFVSAVAWIFIVLTGFATLMSLLQNIMVHVMLPAMGIDQTMEKAEGHVPDVVVFMFRWLRVLVLFFLVVCVASLVSSIGLLMRRNWARILFIAMLAFGIAWQVAGIVMTGLFVAFWMPEIPATSPAAQEYAAHFATMRNVIVATNIVVTVVLLALFAWIIKRLVSAEIRREFTIP